MVKNPPPTTGDTGLIPGSGIELMSPALAGEFLITGPPGKSQSDQLRDRDREREREALVIA